MRTHIFTSIHVLPRPVEQVFPFFADARNLEKITPPWLRFNVLTPAPLEMQPGARIKYRLSLRGLPISWESVITEWNPPYGFIDEQVRGPYRRWRHEHRFKVHDGGTEVSDRVEYSVWGGSIINALLVEPDVRNIFEFRRQKLAEWSLQDARS
jgi:ligand-binding SRPBCC domain-containing protein